MNNIEQSKPSVTVNAVVSLTRLELVPPATNALLALRLRLPTGQADL